MGKANLNLTAVALFLCSAASHASIISYGLYTHDTNTDIVAGDGLEWLQWDRTLGMSWNEANNSVFLDSIEGGGWSIANSAQMAGLYSNFFEYTWIAEEDKHQSFFTPIEEGYEAGSDLIFISMFGDTVFSGDYISPHPQDEGGLQAAHAWYGSDENSNNKINRAVVEDDYVHVEWGLSGGAAQLYKDDWDKDGKHPAMGVALVRTALVSEPSTVALIGLGLAGLGFVRRRLIEV